MSEPGLEAVEVRRGPWQGFTGTILGPGVEPDTVTMDLRVVDRDVRVEISRRDLVDEPGGEPRSTRRRAPLG